MNTEKIKQWLLHRDSHYELRTMELFQNLILLAVFILIFFAIYSNADALNAEPILIFRLGGIIMLALLAGGFIFAKKAFVNLKYGFKGATNAVKIIVLLFILNSAIFAYQNQGEIGKFFEEKNADKIIGKLNPIYFSFPDNKDFLLSDDAITLPDISEIPINYTPYIPEKPAEEQEDCETQAYNIKTKQWECFEEKTVPTLSDNTVFGIGNSVQNKFEYILRGNNDYINFPVYKELNDFLAGKSRYYYCDPVCPTKRELELRDLDEEKQREELNLLVKAIKEKASEKDEQARIAIALVQTIPYDWVAFQTDSVTGRYPYEVLYDKTGVCGEKSKLLAYLLRELGFGVALFVFGDYHMAVGIKCPPQYAQYNSSYCFIETTSPSIPTDTTGNYIGVGTLSSNPEIILINDGLSFDSIEEEFNDAKEYQEISSMGGILPRPVWNRWKNIVDKYGFEFD